MTLPIQNVRTEICPPGPGGGREGKRRTPHPSPLPIRWGEGEGSRMMGAELKLADAAPLRIGGFALKVSVAGKRDGIGQRVRPMGGELGISGAAPFGFDLRGGKRQGGAHDIALSVDSIEVKGDL